MRIAPVSVIVPCFRRVSTIERAVRSVATQTARPAELILVDDGSGDATGDVLADLRQRYGADWIRVLTLPVNAGPGSARNVGWEAATQKYVAFLDSDDAWHPRKIEIQYAWMEAHPEFAVSGHGARQLLSESEIPAEPGTGEVQTVSSRALYRSNPFITPSVMLRRDLPQRFEPGKRHMEDYLLWLEIAADGGRVARLPQVLAFTFKAPFGEDGLSANAWQMEKGELAAFSSLRARERLNVFTWLLLCGFSVLKFLRRMLMLATGYNPAGDISKPTLLYAAAYVVLTQSMTALLIVAGLLGRSELAAEIGVVQAATLATFFAFSGNARNLILTERGLVPRAAIFAARLILLLPLGLVAVLLCVIVGRVDLDLILVLVARRGIEWIGELHLSESELLGRHNVARNTLAAQLILLLVAASALAAESDYAMWVLAAWALLPAIPLLRLSEARLLVPWADFRRAIAQLIPHFGSTAASGMSLYAFRALVVLVAGKPAAGMLFAAFAIGSFPGTIFANILGPSISLHEERVGASHLPKVLWLATIAYLGGAAAALVLYLLAPGALQAMGYPPLFWLALASSLAGGVVMLIAQRVRLRLLATGDARSVFGADLLMHIYLIAAVPTVYAVVHAIGLACLYFLNAVLALLFYVCALRGETAPFSARVARQLVFLTAVCIFLPLFFMIDGSIFNPLEPVVDSGGILSTLPLPISLIGCSAGILLFGRFARTGAALWTIFGLLLMMLVSTAVASGDPGSLGRAKMLLLLQVLLPTFGLVLGSVVDPDDRNPTALSAGILSVIALVVPLQLAATWLYGNWTLRHSTFLFGVYQHLQYVPVILTCGFALVFREFWDRAGHRGRIGLGALYALLAMYSVASHSILAMFVVLVSVAAFAAWRLRHGRDIGAVVLMLTVLTSGVAYQCGVTRTIEYRQKFGFLLPWGGHGEYRADVASHVPGIRRGYFSSWHIDADRGPGVLITLHSPDGGVRGRLVVEGELAEGALEFKVRGKGRKLEDSEAFALRASITKPGPFRVEFDLNPAAGDDEVWIFQPVKATRAVIRDMTWKLPGSAPPRPGAALSLVAPASAADAVKTAPASPQKAESGIGEVHNLVERFSDWLLFGRGIVESPVEFLFGHATPLAREQRSSAHNFYIDFTYNFGLLALLPILALIVYTVGLLWRARQHVLRSDRLLLLAVVVGFLVLVESNLKVTLRQPYPGIAVFFLWGLLLARLQAQAAGGRAS